MLCLQIYKICIRTVQYDTMVVIVLYSDNVGIIGCTQDRIWLCNGWGIGLATQKVAASIHGRSAFR